MLLSFLGLGNQVFNIFAPYCIRLHNENDMQRGKKLYFTYFPFLIMNKLYLHKLKLLIIKRLINLDKK